VAIVRFDLVMSMAVDDEHDTAAGLLVHNDLGVINTPHGDGWGEWLHHRAG